MLAGLTVERIRDELSRAVPITHFDSDPNHYEITNLRYTPGQKLVLSLESPQRKKPISLRVFRSGIARGRFETARSHHPDGSFLLDSLNAVAWVFPAERKLNLGIVADENRLKKIFAEHRNITVEELEIVHFVPEHTYTARVAGRTAAGTKRTEFLKIYADDRGAKTASIMVDFASQTSDTSPFIMLPANTSYIPAEKMLVQAALPIIPEARLTDADAARALASFHRLTSQHASWQHDTEALAFGQAQEMIGLLFPRHQLELASIRAGIHARSAEVAVPDRVLIHGDAHLGNLLPIAGSRVGIIDLDGTCWGFPDHDLATYFAFKLWLRVRAGEEADSLLDEFPAFIENYNTAAAQPISMSRAYLRLATKMVTERVRRAIARGKLTNEDELEAFIQLANCCLERSGYNYA